MATTTDLTTIVANATGVNQQSVVQILRNLRAANLLSVGGRGRHAARMTIKDVALVIIAMLISDRPVDAVQAVRDSMLFKVAYWSGARNPKTSIFAFQTGDRVPCDEPRGPLGLTDAVAYVIEKLAKYEPHEEETPTFRDEEKPDFVELCFNSQNISCQIKTALGERTYMRPEGWAQFVPKRSTTGDAALVVWDALRKSYQHSKISVQRTIHHSTLVEIAQSFAEATQ